ncbi:YlbG family protein [Aerococcaceae bacterium 50-4]
MSIYDEAQTRQELIVWMYSNKKVKQLQKYGFVYYVSWKMKYAVLYTDMSEADHIQKNLEKLHFVRQVDVSPRQEMATDYATAFDAYAADLATKKELADKDRLNERYA